MKFKAPDARLVSGPASAAFAACALFAASAMAAPVLVGTAGNATGVSGLVVGTSVFDVSFVAQSYNTVYPADDAPFLGNLAGANQATTALAEFLNAQDVTGVLGFNCIGTNQACGLNIPVVSDVATNRSDGTRVQSASFFYGDPDWRGATGVTGTVAGYTSNCVGIVTGNPCYNDGVTGLQALAVFNLVPPSPVPEPSVLAMLAVGMAGLGLTRRRRRP